MWATKVPTRSEARQNRVKLPEEIAQALSPLPAIPKTAPRLNPARRPIRPISSEAGTVLTITPAICMASGRVASDLFTARALPTRAVTEMINALQLIPKVWQSAKRKTLRTVGSLVADSSIMGAHHRAAAPVLQSRAGRRNQSSRIREPPTAFDLDQRSEGGALSILHAVPPLRPNTSSGL
jgi:hypothetical protein